MPGPTGEELARYLARNGVPSEPVTVSPEGRSTGEAILAQAAARGGREEALALQDRLIGLHGALFADNSPAPAKWGLARLGLCAEDVRAPLAPCGEAAQVLMRAAMHAAGLSA